MRPKGFEFNTHTINDTYMYIYLIGSYIKQCILVASISFLTPVNIIQI